MFAPHHTIESTTLELITGLERRDIVLHSEELDTPTIEEIKKRLQSALIRCHRQERRYVFFSFFSALAGFLGVFLAVVITPQVNGEGTQSLIGLLSFILGIMTSGVIGSVYALIRARSKTVELKTYASLLKESTSLSPEQVISRIIRRLANRRLVSR